jgi:hypothetical protein
MRSPIGYVRSRAARRERLVVVSFPKSGRTWLRFMLDQLGLPVKFSHENSDKGASLEYTRENIRLSLYRRVVFLHRNPLDTLVSHYHARVVQQRFGGPISDFVRHDEFGIRYLLEFNKAWLEAGDRFEHFLPVSYEELRQDTAVQLRRIVDFCNIARISDRAIGRAVRAGEFRSMKQLEQSGELAKLYPGKFADAGAGRNQSKVRSGQVGSYRNELGQDDIDYCIQQAREVGWPVEKLLAPGDPQLRS